MAPAPVVVATAPPPPEPVYVEPAATVEVAYVEPTSYVYINPQVQVIEDYDYPVFFFGGLYWRNEGGVWYSSSWHDRGWSTSVEVPVYIRTIDRPTQYVHYRADVHARVGQPGYRGAPAMPVRHTAPPPRYVEQPGRPVRAEPHPQPMHEAGRPPEPVHPMPAHEAGRPPEPVRPVYTPGQAAAPPPVHPEPMHPDHPEHPAHPEQGRPEPPPMHNAPAEPARPAPPPPAHQAAPVYVPGQAAHPAPPAPAKKPPPKKP